MLIIEPKSASLIYTNADTVPEGISENALILKGPTEVDNKIHVYRPAHDTIIGWAAESAGRVIITLSTEQADKLQYSISDLIDLYKEKAHDINKEIEFATLLGWSEAATELAEREKALLEMRDLYIEFNQVLNERSCD